MLRAGFIQASAAMMKAIISTLTVRTEAATMSRMASGGMVSTMSVMVLMTRSSQPPKKPATRPRKVPTSVPMRPATRPSRSVCGVLAMITASRSRPPPSVPSR